MTRRLDGVTRYDAFRAFHAASLIPSFITRSNHALARIPYAGFLIGGAASAYHAVASIVKTDRNIVNVIGRCLRLRCPACGGSSILKSLFKIRHHCPTCNALFQREEGFFVGALTINVVTTEIIILLLYLVCLILFTGYTSTLTVLFAAALVFPVAFYHHSWSIWLGLDHLVESLPYYKPSGKELKEK